jgi:S-DNA-T family DNA segregation ATPase FtsK/SpoIIIE
VVVGRSAAVTLPLADPEVSRAHALVGADADGATVVDPGSRNGISYRGFRLQGVARPRPGEPVLLGESALAVRPAPHRAAVVTAGDDGPAVDRAPRIVQPPPEREVAYPDAPHEQPRRRLPLIAALAPLVLAGVLYLVLPSAGPYLLFLALSPVLFVATALADRRHSGADAKRDAARYGERRRAADARVAALLGEEQVQRREADPDPAAVLSAVLLPTARLWERRLTDADALRLRFGSGDAPATLAVRAGRGADDNEPLAEPVVTGVPIAVGLREAGVAGLAGPRATQLAWARAAVCQLAALHAPEDVGLLVLTGRDEAADWEWSTWLPHTRPGSGDPDAPARLVAAGAEQAEARVVTLRRLVGHRQDAQRSRLDEAVAGRRYVVVVDGARRMRGLRGLSSLLADGPAAGVVFLCLDDDPAALPAECRVTALVDAGGTRATVRTPAGSIEDVLLDGLSVADAERCATALAPLRLLGSRDVDDEGVPTSVRLLDELDAAEDEDAPGGMTPDPVRLGPGRRDRQHHPAAAGPGRRRSGARRPAP